MILATSRLEERPRGGRRRRAGGILPAALICAALCLGAPLVPSSAVAGHAAEETVPYRHRGQAEITQRGDLFVTFDGGISPITLPRRTPAPISVQVEGRIRVLSGLPPALRRITISLNRAGHLDTTGLPVCRRSQIESTSTAGALAACRSALVGEGSFAAASAYPEQSSFPVSAHILAFNAKSDGRQAILAHVYGTDPLAASRIFTFRLRHPAGSYGTVLSAYIPPSLNPNGYLKRISLRLDRTFAYRGRTHSYLSAACAAPPGFPGASFALAHASMTFEDGRTLSSTLIRSCRVRGN